MKKQLVIAGTAATLGLAGLAGGAAFATTQSGTNTDPMSGLVSAIATKFNLKAADVQAVFDANRAQMDAQREQQAKDQVAQLVKDGKLTQAQADKINAKRTELEKAREAERTADQKLNETERQAKREQMSTQMDAKKTELDTWLKDNGIDTQYAYLLMGGGHGHGGPGGDGGPRESAGVPSTSTSSTGSTSTSSSSN